MDWDEKNYKLLLNTQKLQNIRVFVNNKFLLIFLGDHLFE
jgi:hypothetical protein